MRMRTLTMIVAVPINPIGAVSVELPLAIAFGDDADALSILQIGDDNLILVSGTHSSSTMAMLSAVPP
jgi:hypothetical protein